MENEALLNLPLHTISLFAKQQRQRLLPLILKLSSEIEIQNVLKSETLFFFATVKEAQSWKTSELGDFQQQWSKQVWSPSPHDGCL